MKPLIEKFNLTRPIVFEEMEKGHKVIALPDKTIIRTDDESAAQDMAELFSLAKLAEIDPLLCTFRFQENFTEKEASYMRQFHQLCQPLQDAWAWKTMRKQAPDIYEKAIQETYEMFLVLQEEGKAQKDADNRRIFIGIFCILYENPENNVDIKLLTDNANRDDWGNYIAALKKYTRLGPDTKHYLALPEITNAEYTVEITPTNYIAKAKRQQD